MKISMEPVRLSKLQSILKGAEDAEDLGNGGYTFDAMAGERPVALEIVIEKNAVDVLAAAYLEFSPEMDGWYLGERIDEVPLIQSILDRYIDEEAP